MRKAVITFVFFLLCINNSYAITHGKTIKVGNWIVSISYNDYNGNWSKVAATISLNKLGSGFHHYSRKTFSMHCSEKHYFIGFFFNNAPKFPPFTAKKDKYGIEEYIYKAHITIDGKTITLPFRSSTPSPSPRSTLDIYFKKKPKLESLLKSGKDMLIRIEGKNGEKTGTARFSLRGSRQAINAACGHLDKPS